MTHLGSTDCRSRVDSTTETHVNATPALLATSCTSPNFPRRRRNATSPESPPRPPRFLAGAVARPTPCSLVAPVGVAGDPQLDDDPATCRPEPERVRRACQSLAVVR